MSKLESRMVLHRFMCDQFGYENLRKMLKRLDGLPKEFIDGGVSRCAQAMVAYIHPYAKGVTRDDLVRYDQNIIGHSQALGMTDERERSWKPFQYLALLFTERYLDLYFQDPESLVGQLNEWKRKWRAYSDVPDYAMDGLHTLAFQSATGSGKTLLLHANILQYRRCMEEHNRLHKLNRIILLTPDEGLSRQHLRELRACNIPARLFSDQEETGVFSQGGMVVDIIDLHKLDEKKGVKRVALESFEENNLVMVDEGHLGTGGKVWRKRRKRIAANGFTFEYSATFNQAVSGSGEEIKKLRDEYGKSILFDYSYKFFYEDGYGKDYQISNLQQTDDGEANNKYLLACLLTFYQQCHIYEDKGGQWRDFNLAPPLWVFLGKTVTGGKSAGSAETKSDVIKIVKFLAWVQSGRQQVLETIARLVSNHTGLIDENGADIFSGSFAYIKDEGPQKLYERLLVTVFHSAGRLHVSHLTGTDELQLSAGDNRPYGVINVGDASGLYTKLQAVGRPLFSLSKNAFNKPLFADVDRDHSPVNIVIGARKFAAGWNSWRVSTMGLMHVGTGEGPQIIQMFGRGVRLKGYDMSLKRHTALAGASPQDGEQLKRLETLNIFGLKANYMDKFKAYLQKEGVKLDRVTIILPTQKQFGDAKHLKTIKKRNGVGEFQHSDKRLDLPQEPDERDFVRLDLRRRLQVLESDKNQAGDGALDQQDQWFEENRLPLISKQSVYHKVLERKHRSSWHNMTISQETVNALLENQQWYALHVPAEKLELSAYGRVREWENLAADLIGEYADHYWRRQRSVWENERLEMAPLDDKNPNYVEQYELSVDAHEENLIKDLEQLADDLNANEHTKEVVSGKVNISLLNPSFHAYRPLLHASTGNAVQITPVALDDAEAQFVKCLEDVVLYRHNLDCLEGKELYLMRNLSRGKGVSFFDDYGFYPDFILWVTDSKRQDILFIDPKGLAHYDGRVQSKIDLHVRIKDTERKIQKKHPEIFLSSYIWSHTRREDVGAAARLSLEAWHEKGVFFAQHGSYELRSLLKHALG